MRGLLFEFCEQRSAEPQVARIAAAGFDEARAYLHWLDPDFEVANVQNFGLIVIISGSPVGVASDTRQSGPAYSTTPVRRN
jgi:hypothetical protein